MFISSTLPSTGEFGNKKEKKISYAEMKKLDQDELIAEKEKSRQLKIKNRILRDQAKKREQQIFDQKVDFLTQKLEETLSKYDDERIVKVVSYLIAEDTKIYDLVSQPEFAFLDPDSKTVYMHDRHVIMLNALNNILEKAIVRIERSHGEFSPIKQPKAINR